MLARFVFTSRHIRPSDHTIKPDAFMPHPYAELSDTRHRDATEDELWDVGRAISGFQKRALHGRGDVRATVFRERGLTVVPDPVIDDALLPDNANHANVIGWPMDDKAQQKLLALEISRQAALKHPPL